MIKYTLHSSEICALCEADERLALVIRQSGELSYSPYDDPFKHIVESIVGQMLSSKAADTIVARLYKLCGAALTADSILQFDVPVLREIGLSKNKAEYILNIATLTVEQPRFFDSLAELIDEEVVKKLTTLRGIGTWTAKMYLIFVLNRPDILPFEDGAFLQAYRWLYETDDLKPAAIIKRCASWSPYSSIAARYMYHALDHGLTRDTVLREKLAGMK